MKNNPISGKTKMIAVFGWPLTYTLSPAFQNAGLAAIGMDAAYVPLAVETGPGFRALFKALGAAPHFLGGNVTNPHKLEAFKLAQSLTPEARAIGAVNTLYRRGGKWVGHNTDAAGFLAALKAEGCSLRGRKVLLLGAGGAARGLVFACLKAGAKQLVLASRRPAQGAALKRHFGAQATHIGFAALAPGSMAALFESAEVIVNCVPGSDFAAQAAKALSSVSGRKIICDISYVPKQNAWLTMARKKGHIAVDGLGMLLEQGCLSFAYWTGKKAPRTIMRNALIKAS